MKSFKSTGVFALIVTLFLGYVYFFEYRGKIKEAEKKSEASKVFAANVDDIIGFKIEKQGNEIEVTKGTDGNWNLVKPVKDLADKNSTESMLKQLLEEKSDSTVAEGDSINLTYFGLDKPFAKITVILKDNKTITVSMGSVNGISSKQYIQVNQDKKILMVGASWPIYANKVVKDFRNKDIFKITKEEISEILIQADKKLEFKKTDGIWQLKGDYAKETDQQAVNNFVQDLVQMNASDFASEDKNKFKADSETSSVIITTSQGNKLTAKFLKNGKDKKYYLTLANRENVFEVYERYWQMLQKTPHDFRDKNLPFEFDQTKVSQIDYKTDAVKFELKKEGVDWKSTSDSVDSDKVRELLGQLSNLKVQKFYGKNAGLFLHPKGTITLKDESGTSLFNFQWGNPDNKNNVTVVKTNKNNELLGIGTDILAKLPGETILKKQAVK